MLLLFVSYGFSQQQFHGKISNSGDVEGIHVFNKTASKYTITNEKGEFYINSNVNDTLIISAIQFRKVEHVVKADDFGKTIYFILIENINELDEVFIKPKLTGILVSDAKNIKTKTEVNAKTIGLPNADVVPPTQAERRLQTAGKFDFKYVMVGQIPLDPLINAISGRTKHLKGIVEKEKLKVLEQDILKDFDSIILSDFNVPEDRLYEFLFYVSSDGNTKTKYRTNNNIVFYEFLKEKSVAYLKVNTEKK